MNQQEIRDQVISSLSQVSLRERVEILANVFIFTGLQELSQVGLTAEHVTLENVVKLVVDHKQEHGETIGSALALQGIAILSWLEK